jgi:hypothetical protein
MGFATAGRAFSVEMGGVVTDAGAKSSSPTRSTSGCCAATEDFLEGLRTEFDRLGMWAISSSPALYSSY